ARRTSARSREKVRRTASVGPLPAIAAMTVPAGTPCSSGPGPATPVSAAATSAPLRLSAPTALALAQASLTPPERASTAARTPQRAPLARARVGDRAALQQAGGAGYAREHRCREPRGQRLGQRDLPPARLQRRQSHAREGVLDPAVRRSAEHRAHLALDRLHPL